MRGMSKVEKKYENRLKLMKQGMYYLSLTKQDRVRKWKKEERTLNNMTRVCAKALRVLHP